MKRIIIHWTAGTNQPNKTDYEHYHFLVNGDGLIVKGKYEPSDNENCSDGKYAAHTGGGNTGSIGIALCGMYGFKNRNSAGKYPLTKKQCETAFKLIAEQCKKYNIPINPASVMTHFEFGIRYPKTTSKGKIDIVYLPPYPEIAQAYIGEFIRNKVKWYFERI